MFKKILIANRGEIALRIIRACRELGVATVVAYSEADRLSLPVQLADEAICIGPASAEKSYLNIPNVVSAALVTGAEALHPGYGFLSENAYLAEVCEHCGISFIGPSARTIEQFSDKSLARRRMREVGLPVLPGVDTPLHTLSAALQAADEIGFPVMVKACAGGGGRGLRVAASAEELARVFPIAQMEAQTAFGSGTLYLEALVERARHVEIQVLVDSRGNAVHLGERDCSVQRRHQKLVEESPCPVLGPDVRRAMGEAAAAAAAALGYEGAGTLEFLLDRDGRYYFIEINTRIQVEHPVTEAITGIDLVKWQLLLAAGEPLAFDQSAVSLKGHAIECRVNAEDPERGFSPRLGVIDEFLPPGGPGIRVDSHLYSGYPMPAYYDSLLAKVIAWGHDRREAISRMTGALRELRVVGVPTNVEFHLELLAREDFRRGAYDTGFVGRLLAEGARPGAHDGGGPLLAVVA